jgi:UDP-N-acetylmuramate dehydrogenase
MNIQENFSLKNHNTFGIDARCRYFVEYCSEEELQRLLQSDFLRDKPYFFIGGGSNLLFTRDFEGAVLHSLITDVELLSEDADTVLVRVGAGVTWDDFVALCVERTWYGVENLSLIPGEVGASPVQNIGAYGVEAKDVIHEVEGIELATQQACKLSNAECRFGYRDSIFKHELKGLFIVTRVVFRLSKTPAFHLDYGTVRDEVAKQGSLCLQAVRQTIINIRQDKLPDPKVQGNAGSFFKNPVIGRAQFEHLQQQYPTMPSYKLSDEEVKIPAAWLIEQSGWEGHRQGNAAVHSKQALVLVNAGNATGAEVVALSDAICQAVLERFDIRIFPEVILI